MKSESVNIQDLPRCTLKDNEVHIWYGKMADQMPLEEYFKVLDEKERARYAAYKAPKKQQEFLLGRFFTKSILASYLAIPATAIVLSINQHKRPHLSKSTLQFNLSHSFGAFALIISQQYKIGIDIEYIPRKIEIESGRHVFMPAEIASMRSKDKEAAKQEFLSRWTLKEAIYKAADQGPKLLFNEFQVDVEGIAFQSQTPLLPPIHRNFGTHAVWEEYLFSYAIENPKLEKIRLHAFEVDF